MPPSRPSPVSNSAPVPAAHSRAGLLQVSAAALLWGTVGVAVSIVHDRAGLSAVTIGWYRVAIATVVLALFARGRLVRLGIRAVRRRPALLLACGAGFGAYQALYFIGVQNVGVSVATLVSLGLAPVALTVGAACARRRLPGAGSLVVLALAVIGLALVSLRPGSGVGAPHPLAGLLASIASGLGYAATTALSRRLPEQDPLVLTGVTSAVAAGVLAPFAFLAGPVAPHDAISAGWLGYLGVLPTVVAYWLFYRGLRTTAAEVAGVLTLLEPLAAAALAAVVLHEALSGWALLGGGLMLLAVGSFYIRRTDPSAVRQQPEAVATRRRVR